METAVAQNGTIAGPPPSIINGAQPKPKAIKAASKSKPKAKPAKARKPAIKAKSASKPKAKAKTHKLVAIKVAPKKGAKAKTIRLLVPKGDLCSQKGCGSPARAKGMCSKHYQASRRHSITKGTWSGHGRPNPKSSLRAATNGDVGTIDQLFASACKTLGRDPEIRLNEFKLATIREALG